jgi:hypothetical protein
MSPPALDQILETAAAQSSGQLHEWLSRLREGEQAQKKAAAPAGSNGPECLISNSIVSNPDKQSKRKRRGVPS